MRRVGTYLGSRMAPSERHDTTRESSSLAICTGLASLLLASSVAAAPPVPLSPGSADASVLVDARCPTFSWGGVEGGDGVELVVLRVSSSPDGEPEPVWRLSLPADARSFTPPLSSCLERDGRYAWSVAVRQASGAMLDWSPPLLFRVDGDSAATDGEREQETPDIDSVGSRVPPEQSRPNPVVTTDAALPIVEPEPLSDLPRLAPTRPERDRVDATLDRNTVARTVGAGTVVLPGSPALRVNGDIALGAASNLFKNDEPFVWDDSTGNTALGRNALASGGGTDGRSTAVGWGALRNAAAGAFGNWGSDNTALGFYALGETILGYWNTAIGAFALTANTSGSFNSAIGRGALIVNGSGGSNVAIGVSALGSNTTGSGNVAIGAGALASNTSGNRNIAIGEGVDVPPPGMSNRNILIGAPAVGPESNTIRLGSHGLHERTFLAGDVGILGTGNTSTSPTNRLQVEESINSAGTPENHVALVKNTHTGNNADVLALQIGGTSNPATSNNFLSFFLGNGTTAGAIEGNGSNSVVLSAAGADYAEWLRLLDPAEAAQIAPGDVVGLHGDAVSLRTAGATQLFVVSTSPIVAGGDPGEDLRHLYARVAFVGQAPVRVRGLVRAGDLLVASGEHDGVAIAWRPERTDREGVDPVPSIVGRALEALEASDGAGAGVTVLALVGLPGQEPWASLLHRQSQRIVTLEQRLVALEEALRLARDGRSTSP